ncbi:uncharacterized protein LOC141659312 isoform X2 [Apium graveolens]|uniref:uncharacterized protein LOC141659312 isoform X2 n=1 Tax=Apium graveolens TaxID=4045 RepID=UPI003D7B86E1
MKLKMSRARGDARIKGIQKLNLVREFEIQKMNDSETIKEYTGKLLSIANKIRLFGSDFSDSSLKNTKDLSTITLKEISNALQAQEQRRLMREEGSMEGALQAKLHINRGEKDKKGNSIKSISIHETLLQMQATVKGKDTKNILHVNIVEKGHPPFKCWKRPDVKCGKCNKMRHDGKICRAAQAIVG